MRIRLLTIPKHYYLDGWPGVGETMDVPEGLGAHMIAHGEAERIIETAEVAAPERAARTYKPQARKYSKE